MIFFIWMTIKRILLDLYEFCFLFREELFLILIQNMCYWLQSSNSILKLCWVDKLIFLDSDIIFLLLLTLMLVFSCLWWWNESRVGYCLLILWLWNILITWWYFEILIEFEIWWKLGLLLLKLKWFISLN